MKTRLFTSIIAVIFIFSFTNAQIKVQSDGSTTFLSSFWAGGIRVSVLPFANTGLSTPCIYPTSPFYLTLGTQSNYIAGAYIYHIWSAIYDTWPSDKRLKNNIQKIDSAIQKIKLLNPVKYDVNSSVYDSVPGKMKDVILQDTKNRLGFVAQELQAVFPQSVHKEPTSGYYGISTMDLIPVLVQAIKDQQTMIEDLQKKVNGVSNNNQKSAKTNDTVPTAIATSMAEITDTITIPKSPVTTDSISVSSNNSSNNIVNAQLEQNNPNPFNSKTTINYYLPTTTKSAFIYIYDLQGLQKKALKLSGTGNGSIAINGSELVAGMYYYTLVVDGKEIDTKKMILTQ